MLLQKKCDEQLLEAYSNTFLGYGALNSSLWLVGPEAGGGDTIEEVQLRASVWANGGCKQTADLQDYHSKLRLPEKYNWKKKIQPTWGCLIRVVLALNGYQAETEDVRKFQVSELGNINGLNAILDLSQLSSPKLGVWNFGACGIDWLQTREKYERKFLRGRCGQFENAASDYQPRLVLFYGLSHLAWWERIAGGPFAASGVHQLSWRQGTNSLFAVMPHPNAIRLSGEGARNKYLSEVGVALSQKL